jgi:hypothetical protein
VVEKRKLKRRHLIYYLRVFDKNNDQLIGHLIDITTEGVMLISEKPIKPNSDFQARMVLPTGIEGHKPVLFDARSVWCHRDVNPHFYATGFQLTGISQEDVETINRLIDKFGFRD